MNLLRHTGADILNHLRREVSAEEVRQEETRKVHTLVRICVTVVIGDARRVHPEDLAGHVRQEARLIIPGGLIDADVREALHVQNIVDFESLVAAGGPAVHIHADPRERLLLCMNILRLRDALTDNGVEEVVLLGSRVLGSKNELADVQVRHHAESTEQDKQRDIRLDARNGGAQKVDLRVLRVIHDLHRIVLGNLVIVRADALDLNDLHLLGGIAVVAEDEGAIL